MAKQRFLSEIVAEMDSPEWRESIDRDYEIFKDVYERGLDFGHERAVKAALAVLADYWFQEYRENE